MKIIGGKLKGKPLLSPEGDMVRPTSGRIRETIFNILASKNAVADAKVLDLFCGSGALGIESFSRGAKEVVFIDKSRESAKLALQNLAACGFNVSFFGETACGTDGTVARVYNTDYQVALKKLEGEKFDLVFLDPPYFDKLEEKSLLLLKKHEILADGGVIVFEHSSKNSLSEKADGFIIDTRKFGGTSVSFLSVN